MMLHVWTVSSLTFENEAYKFSIQAEFWMGKGGGVDWSGCYSCWRVILRLRYQNVAWNLVIRKMPVGWILYFLLSHRTKQKLFFLSFTPLRFPNQYRYVKQQINLVSNAWKSVCTWKLFCLCIFIRKCKLLTQVERLYSIAQ